MRIVHWLETWPHLLVAAGAFVTLLFIEWLDFITGSEIDFSIICLLPRSAVTWSAGRRWGLAFCVISAALWGASDIASRAEGVS